MLREYRTGEVTIGTKVTTNGIKQNTWESNTKQDKLTSNNAGSNITITEENGVPKINSIGGSSNNNEPLTFTGASNETYDGSLPKTINIPTPIDDINPYELVVSDFVLEDNASLVTFTSNSYPRLEDSREVFVEIKRNNTTNKYINVLTGLYASGDKQVFVEDSSLFNADTYVFIWCCGRSGRWDYYHSQQKEEGTKLNPVLTINPINSSTWKETEQWKVVQPRIYKKWNKLSIRFNVNPLEQGSIINVWIRK